jgi:DNA-binding MarR family transcriptional regulator
VAINVAKISRYKYPEDNFGFLLWQLMHIWQRMMDELLSPIGITHFQFVILIGLAWLTREGGNSTQIQIASFCKLSPALVSQVLRILERKKLVARVTHAIDTRAKSVTLTRDGELRVEKAAAMLELVEDRFFSRASPAAHKKLRPLLLDVLGSLTRESTGVRSQRS